LGKRLGLIFKEIKMLTPKPFGKTGLKVSPIVLGTVKIGRNQGVKYPTAFELPEDKEVITLFETAKELGINTIDTAASYGLSEQRIGQLLHKVPNDWLISTKVGEEFENGESTYIFTPEHIQMSIERSLKHLKRDALDIVLIHSDGDDLVNMQKYGTLEYLLDLKQKGLIRAVGASTKTIEGGKYALDHADVVMAAINTQYLDEKPVFDYAAELGKTTLVKKAMNSGHLSTESDEHPLAFVMKQEGVGAIVSGTLNPKHLKDNVEVVASVC
jgi:aryl-alcohol dehydrogenase-like predicted oxidoreductase